MLTNSGNRARNLFKNDYATQNATQIFVNCLFKRNISTSDRVQIPLSPPDNKTEQNRIVATNGLTVRFSLILKIPKFCSCFREIVNKSSVLDNHATQNATRKSRFSSIKKIPRSRSPGVNIYTSASTMNPLNPAAFACARYFSAFVLDENEPSCTRYSLLDTLITNPFSPFAFACAR